MVRNAWDEVFDKADFARAGKPVLVGMAAVLAVLAAVAGYVLSGAAAANDFTVEASSVGAEAAQDAGEGRTVFVHVSGAVAKAGLYELPEGSRVADAVEAAGGFSDQADADSCNLARVLEDGEHVIVGMQGDSGPGGDAGDAGPAEAQAGAAQRVNVNTATASQLEALPGIGASTAQKIVADRAQNGAFKSVDELTRVSGIGEKKLAAIADLVCV